MPDKNWSEQQIAIFDEFRNGKGHVILDARAGCGKTTTVIEGVEHAPEPRILLCAFNKIIAEELKSRIRNPRAQARTLHSLGNGIVFKRWGRTQVDERRGQKIAANVIGLRNPPRGLVGVIAKLAALGKNIAPFATTEKLVEIGVDFDLLDEIQDIEWGADLDPWTLDEVASAAHEAMARATEKDGTIDYDDMVYLPVRCKWAHPQFDMVIVDEAQDMNATQLALARAVCAGRIIVVGDPNQAIYKWRGADSDSMARLETELSAKRLGLTTTYRCPRLIVEMAQKFVPDFTAAPEAPEGEVFGASEEQMLENVKAGDFVLSRKNAPLARICLALLRDGKRAVVRGRDIGKGLAKIIERLEAVDLNDAMGKLGAWQDRATQTLVAQNASDTKIEFICDQADTLRELAIGLASLQELHARLESLFSDNNIGSAIICSTVHKAKGLESDRVYTLEDTFFVKRKDSKVGDEERNIRYVAITRSKNTLVLVN